MLAGEKPGQLPLTLGACARVEMLDAGDTQTVAEIDTDSSPEAITLDLVMLSNWLGRPDILGGQ